MEESIKALITSQTKLAEQVLGMVDDIRHMKEEIIFLTNQNNDLKKKVKELEELVATKETNTSTESDIKEETKEEPTETESTETKSSTAKNSSADEVLEFVGNFFKGMEEISKNMGKK